MDIRKCTLVLVKHFACAFDRRGINKSALFLPPQPFDIVKWMPTRGPLARFLNAFDLGSWDRHLLAGSGSQVLIRRIWYPDVWQLGSGSQDLVAWICYRSTCIQDLAARNLYPGSNTQDLVSGYLVAGIW